MDDQLSSGRRLADWFEPRHMQKGAVNRPLDRTIGTGRARNAQDDFRPADNRQLGMTDVKARAISQVNPKWLERSMA
jgi:hypothetical protein